MIGMTSWSYDADSRARQHVAMDDLVDFTPEIRQMAIEAVAPYRIGPLYTPHSLRDTIVRPGFSAGSWGGAAVDPETGMLYVPSGNRYTVKHFRTPEPGEDATLAVLEARGAEAHRPQMPQGLPLFKPPTREWVVRQFDDRHRHEHGRAPVEAVAGRRRPDPQPPVAARPRPAAAGAATAGASARC